MQTLKTAAIVVLIMTVLYGAYVSLTTPPEPLPAEIETMLVETGELDIESGFPSPSEMFAIDDGQGPLTGPRADSTAPAMANVEFGVPEIGVSTNALASSDPKVVPTTGPAPLPAVMPSSFSSPSPQADPTRSYPATNEQFSLPDPNSVASSFAKSEGLSYSLGDRSGSSSADAKPTTASLSDQRTQAQPVGMSLPPSDLIKTASATSSSGFASPPLAGAANPVESPANLGLVNAIQTADKQYKADQRKEALATLSLFYATPNLTPSDREQLLSRLDVLAGEVIYSRRHLLEQPHRVGNNETLMEIAGRYDVPWQLLANINGITDPVTVLPGTELKVVRGPFRADIDLGRSELTLFLGDLYACRFPVAAGHDPEPKPGTYAVLEKQVSRTYYDASGTPVPANSPNNPYGTVWMDLGGQLSIHGSPDRTRPGQVGCVSLAGDYADDLYGILSQGSSVTIRR